MKVSIIVPIYNVEPYIRECLESVASQTLSDGVECILVDDCGVDNSVRIAEEVISQYVGNIKFVILHHKKNSGLSAARNTGIHAATGEYLHFLDSDDVLLPDAIEKMYKLAEEHEADMVQGCYEADVPMLTNFWKEMPEFTDDKGYIKRTMLDYDHYPIMAQNRLVRRDLILDNNLYFKGGIIHEDNHWTFFLAKHINRLAVCNMPTYTYRTDNPTSIMAVRSMHKEALASKTNISDFCNSIDPEEIGIQKKLIFYNILSMIDGGYYESEADKESLIALFRSKLLLTEKHLLDRCVKLSSSSKLYPKMVHLLVRIFMRKKMDILSRIDNKLYIDLNQWCREKIIIPRLRKKIKNKNVSIIASDCLGGCISHTLGLRFNSPFVNLWLYPKDFIRYCSNIKHYMFCELQFLSQQQVRDKFGLSVNYPVALLDDITIFFMHYHTEDEAKKKWEERTKRINLDNVRLILTERDGCSKEDLIEFSRLPYSTASLVHLPMNDVSDTYYIKGFEKIGFVDNSMVYQANRYFGKMYYDDFDYVSFLNNKTQ